MTLTVGFTYVIIAGVTINLIGKAFYFLTHPFVLAAEQPQVLNFAFGLIVILFFYGLARRLEPMSARRVLLALAVAALLRTVSYTVNSYVPNLWALGLSLFLLVTGTEIAVLYLCLIHLKELRSGIGA